LLRALKKAYKLAVVIVLEDISAALHDA